MPRQKYLQPLLLATTALLLTGARLFGAGDARRPAPVRPFAALMAKRAVRVDSTTATADAGAVATRARTALDALAPLVGRLSHADALGDAFRSYFAFQARHPEQVRKPFLYFVDYGLPSTEPRGWVFDMRKLAVVEGPFTVAHGRGSAPADAKVPTRFSNAFGSNATSLGLYVAQELYGFRGNSGGRSYRSVGMRLMGVSDGFNDNARARRVVAHGAPYVTPGKAGRSEGCPALEPARAKRLLPKLAEGGLVFLFAPDERWLASDPWVGGGEG